MNCKYCNKILNNKNSLAQHEIRCPANENRSAVGFTSLTGKTKGSGKSTAKLIEFNRSRKFDNSLVFVQESGYPRHRLKERIINEDLLPYICACCGMGDIWNGLPLSLQLDHINGINNDNRITNLRFLCPNCHTQQQTYAAKNKKLKRNMPLV